MSYYSLLLATALSFITETHGRTLQPRAPVLPSPAQFVLDNGTRWTIEYVGTLQWTGAIGGNHPAGDKCRSGQIGSQTVWTCGDLQCNNLLGQGDWRVCGFAGGPAFYGTSSPLLLDASGYPYLQDYDFAVPWTGQPNPDPPTTVAQWASATDISNIVGLNDTHGLAYIYAAIRGGGVTTAFGPSILSVTLGPNNPIGTRLGPVWADDTAIEIGGIAALNAGDGYIYSYATGISNGYGYYDLIVGRAPADDRVFSPANHMFMLKPQSAADAQTPRWVHGIPTAANMSLYGMWNPQQGSVFSCNTYGSALYNNYFGKYMIGCTQYELHTNFYLGDTPWGPWTAGYNVLNVAGDYGISINQEWSPGGSDQTLYLSQSPDGPFGTWKLTFNY